VTVTPITAVLLLLSVGVWQLSWSASLPGNRPAPFELPPVRLPMLPVRLIDQAPRWAGAPSNRSTDATAAVVGDFLDGRDHRVSLVMPLERLSAELIERVQHLECRARVAAHDGRVRDGWPWVRCDLVDAAGNQRLAGVPLENVTGTVDYRARWQTAGPAGEGLLKALAAGSVHAELVLGLHGGGDYTDPDRLEVTAVAVTGGP
jgi:hypothetical protein